MSLFITYLLGQSLLTYVVLIIIYFPLFWCHLRQKSQQQRVSTSKLLSDAFRERGMRYFIFAVIDVEGNYLLHKAFQYTTFTSIQVVKSISKAFFCISQCLILHCCRLLLQDWQNFVNGKSNGITQSSF